MSERAREAAFDAMYALGNANFQGNVCRDHSDAAIDAFLAALSEDGDLVERVAKAICWEVNGGDNDLNTRDMAGNRLRDKWQEYEHHARAAIAATLKPEALTEVKS